MVTFLPLTYLTIGVVFSLLLITTYSFIRSPLSQIPQIFCSYPQTNTYSPNPSLLKVGQRALTTFSCYLRILAFVSCFFISIQHLWHFEIDVDNFSSDLPSEFLSSNILVPFTTAVINSYGHIYHRPFY